MISVIIPIYNVEKYLSKCIESILNQTYTDLEIILINDGSSDNCKNICEHYAKIDSRINVINKKNGGVSSARNAGLDICKGDYISFIDPDDYIEPTMYEKMIQIAVSKNIDIISCNYKKINSKGYSSPFFCLKNDELITDKNILLEKVFQYKNFDMVIFNKLYKSYIFKTLRFPLNVNLGEDLHILYPTIHLANRFYCMKDTLYIKTIRTNSLTGNQNIQAYISNVREHEQFLLSVSNDKSLDYTRIFNSCVTNLYRHYKRLLDKLYILDDRGIYQELENKTIKNLCNLYNNKALSNKDRKKIWLLKISPKIYYRYRKLSKLWKNIFNRYLRR